MATKILTQEESDFFSPPLTAAPLHEELFRVRGHGSVEDIFLPGAEPCALLAASDEDMRRLLEDLIRLAQRENILLVCDPAPWPEALASAATILAEPVFGEDGVLDSGTLEKLSGMVGKDRRIVHIAAQRGPRLPQMEALARAQHQAAKPGVFFLTLFSSPEPAALAFALTGYPTVLTPNGCYATGSSPSPAPAAELLAEFEERHRLARKDSLLEAIIDAMPEPVVAGYADGSLAGGNRAFASASGYEPHELATLNWLKDLAWPDFQATQEAMFEAMLRTGLDQEFQIELHAAGGQALPCTVRLYPHAINGQILFFHAECAFSPAESAVAGGSGVDRREMFLLRLRLALQRLDRQQGYRFAILVLGVDHPPFSHPDEEVLFADLIARRTASCLRALDVPAHFDPKRLFIFLDDIANTVDAVRVAQRIQSEMVLPLTIGQTEHEIRCNVGVVLPSIPHPGEEEMLRAAQIALGRAERRGQITFYDERQNDEALRFLRMEKELRAALDSGQLALCFLPVRDVDSGRIVGAEAVLRWHHPQRGVLDAGEFLPLMEQSGIIRDLDAWRLRESCAVLEKMRTAGNFFLVLGIGLKSILRSGFAGEVVRHLCTRNLRPGAIFLKAQEAWLGSHGDVLAAFFAQTREAGLGILLDEFTVDRINLGHLHELALDGLIPDEALLTHPPVAASLGALASETGLAILLPRPVDSATSLALNKYSCRLLGWRDANATPLGAEELPGLTDSGPTA